VTSGGTYLNPVWPRSFPDPFVLKHRGEYWAYCTGIRDDGRAFGILHSRDLVDWRPLAGALEPLPGNHPCYWAPEVAYDNGLFYLYYSVGNEETMEIRVAVADHPAGPFADSGRRLTSEPFAIDAHVFTDSRDGTRWLFYATDFLERSHIGTGTVRDRLLDPFTLAGDPRPVALPGHDWHVYHPARPEKGGARWHTVEGPFVLERKGVCYEMFSGGNWQNPTYGVSYATSAGPQGTEEWIQAADGVRVLPVLRTTGEVVGPGHNSVVRGPDNRQLWCVYHRWAPDSSARVMAIDPLDWAGERMLVLGPTTTPRPRPNGPTVADFFDEPGSGTLAPGTERGYASGSSSFLCEVSLRASGEPGEDACFGIDLRGEEEPLLRIRIGGEWLRVGDRRFLLPSGFDHRAFHLLRVEVDGFRAAARLDEAAASWRGRIGGTATGITLVAEGISAECAGLALTAGWEDLFLEHGAPFAFGWDTLEGEGDWRVEAGRLRLRAADPAAWIAKGPAFEEYELVVNARLDTEEGEGGYGIAPAVGKAGSGPRLLLERKAEGWALVSHGAEERVFSLPRSFEPFTDQHFRFRRMGRKVEIIWETISLGSLEGPPGPARPALGARGAAVSFEAVRLTAIGGQTRPSARESSPQPLSQGRGA
jgi:GH43 family beta-xylosidase